MAPPVTEILQENDRLKDENKLLSLRVKALEKELFGSKSEKRSNLEDPNQKTFESITEEAGWVDKPEDEAPKPKKRTERKGKKKGPKPINPNLPRVNEVVPDPDLKDLICPVTGKIMAHAFDESIEVLARKPAEFYVRHIIRKVFFSPQGDAAAYSPWPANVLPKSRIDVSVIANIVTGRFADHLPYYRQCGQFERLGIKLDPNTMGSLVRQACEKVNPIGNFVRKQVIESGYIQMDPTPIALMSQEKKGSTKEACMWTYRALDGPVFFEFSESKSGKTPAKTLQHYQGILQTDGASNFGGIPSCPGVIHMECWSHARRYFVKAFEAKHPGAEIYLDWMGKLFRIERLARHFKLHPDNLKKLREKYSAPVVDTIFKEAKAYAAKELMRKTPMPKAVRYLLKHEKGLRECFDHAPSRIDNNLAENALRPLKLGVKNWLFIGHANAGPRAAMMFTLVENCRIEGINPEEYLIDILSRVDDHPNSRIEELTPAGWKKSKNA